MAGFCGNCGRQLNDGEVCNCQAGSIQSSIVAKDAKAFAGSILDTVVSYAKKPIGVITENANSRNWISASVIILIAAIFRVFSKVSYYIKIDADVFSSYNFKVYFKTFFFEILMLVAFAGAVFILSKLLNKSKNDFIKTFSAVGIAAIPYAATIFLSAIMNMITLEFTSILTGLAQGLLFFGVILAIKVIDNIEKLDTLFLVGACAVGAFFLADYIFSKILFDTYSATSAANVDVGDYIKDQLNDLLN